MIIYTQYFDGFLVTHEWRLSQCNAFDTRWIEWALWTPLHADFESADLNKRPLNSPMVSSKPVRATQGMPISPLS